jgi:hypothetical protein
MKNMLLYSRLTLLVFSIILISCNHSKKVASQEVETENYFIIGSGGGVSGLYTQYKIYDSGLIEIYDFEKETYGLYLTVDKNQVDEFFNQIIKLDLKNTDYSIPGNISDYIDVLTDDRTINHIVWDNSSSNDFNPEIIQLYDSVMRFINDQQKN